jgi:hypothetical protein
MIESANTDFLTQFSHSIGVRSNLFSWGNKVILNIMAGFGIQHIYKCVCVCVCKGNFAVSH